MSKTLVFTRAFSPYNKGDIATFDDATAKALENPTYINDKGREVPLSEGSPVEAYSEKTHGEQLAKQRGKTKDVEVATPVTGANGYYTGTQIEGIVQARLEAERRRNEENGTPLSADQTKVPVNQDQQARGTVVTDPQGVSADGSDPQTIDREQKEVAAKVAKDNKSSK